MIRSRTFGFGSRFIGRQLSEVHRDSGAWGLSPSTRITSGAIPRRSEHQYVHGRVDVSVVNGSAVGTGPVPDLQRHLGLHRAAPGAGFTRGREAVGDQQHAPVPTALIVKLATQFTERRVMHGFGQPGSGQPFDIQVFNGDGPMFADQLCRLLVQKVLPCVADPCMDSGHAALLALPAVRAFALAAQAPLGAFEPTLIAS